jgi:hypothetical protein
MASGASVDTVSIQSPINALNDKWNLYYHLPDDKNWDLKSYTTIMGDIQTAEEVIALNESIPDQVIKSCMLFLMRKGITPMWEDPRNRTGGCFSYRILNKQVPHLWRMLMQLTCGETLATNAKYNNHINGITISPKKNFCIVKIWMDTTLYQDCAIIKSIENLPVQGCLFKKHEPEF